MSGTERNAHEKYFLIENYFDKGKMFSCDIKR